MGGGTCLKALLSNFKGQYARLILGPLFKLGEAILELLVPLLMARIIDVGIKNGDVRYVVLHGAAMLGLAAVGLCFAIICQYFAATCAYGFGRSLRRQLFHRVMGLSRAEYGAVGTDSLITRLTNDVTQIQTGINIAIRLGVRTPFLTVGSIVMALSINWKVGLIFLISTPLIVAALYLIMSRSVPFYTQIQQRQDRISRLAGENLEGVRVIRAFSKQGSEIETFGAAGDDLAAANVWVGKISAALNPITSVIVNLAIVAIVWLGSRYTDVGILGQGQVIALVNYMTQTLLALVVLANVIVTLTKAMASAGRVAEVLDLESSMAQPAADAADAAPKAGAPRICFSGVGFTYPSGGDKAVEGLTFAVQPGQTLGVIGGTGCGKTTLVRLLCREYDVTEGSLQVDGADVRDYTLKSLRGRIGLVPQTARLFAGTIRSNLQLGAENAPDEALWQALEAAQGAAFVREKPEGLDTVVEEGGKNFSGGQRQRLTIARALAKRPSILILDDSASALDYATDAALRRALKQGTADMTVVMISQRASTIKNADRILVLDDGAQVGFGTHEELLRTCEVYKEICRSQGVGEVSA